MSTSPDLPEGRALELPGRGTTFVRDVPGPAGAPTLLLLHGWTANSAVNWFGVFTPLSRHFRVVAIDQRGHGHGLRTRRRFRLDDCADDAAAVLDALDIDSCIPVGYSMGGPVAQLLWQRHRPRVDGLVLCATAMRFRDRRLEHMTDVALASMAIVTRPLPDRIKYGLRERLFLSKYDDTPLGNWVTEQGRLNDLRTLIEAGAALARFDSHVWLPEVDVPCAVVLTELDQTVPPNRQLQMVDALRDVEVVPLRAGHDACAVRPVLFADAVVEATTSVVERIALSGGTAAATRS